MNWWQRSSSLRSPAPSLWRCRRALSHHCGGGAGRIRIAHSGCPNQDCVHIGWVSRSGGQIVCLPNRLVISVSGSDAPEVDGITG